MVETFGVRRFAPLWIRGEEPVEREGHSHIPCRFDPKRRAAVHSKGGFTSPGSFANLDLGPA